MNSVQILVEFEQRLQEIAAYTQGRLETDEIMLILNASVYRFIHYRINPKSNVQRQGFQTTQNRYDDLESLIREKSLNGFWEDAGRVKFILPADYYHLLSERPHAFYGCGTAIPEPKTIYSQVYFTFELAHNTADYIGFSIYADVAGDNEKLFDSTEYSYYNGGFPDTDELFKLRNHLIDVINLETGWDIYFERFDNLYYPNQFILIDPENDSADVTITYSTTGAGIVHTLAPFTNLNNVYNLSSDDYQDVNPLSTLKRTGDIYKAQHNPFEKSNYESVNFKMDQGRLIYYQPDDLALDTLRISYIRKPRWLDYDLNTVFDLGSTPGQQLDLARQIIDNGAYLAKLYLESGNPTALQIISSTTE
jgi:hypothetical protein